MAEKKTWEKEPNRKGLPGQSRGLCTFRRNVNVAEKMCRITTRRRPGGKAAGGDTGKSDTGRTGEEKLRSILTHLLKPVGPANQTAKPP